MTAKFDSDWSLQVVVEKVITHNVCRLLYLLPPGNENDTRDRRMERQLNQTSYRVLTPRVKMSMFDVEGPATSSQ